MRSKRAFPRLSRWFGRVRIMVGLVVACGFPLIFHGMILRCVYGGLRELYNL